MDLFSRPVIPQPALIIRDSSSSACITRGALAADIHELRTRIIAHQHEEDLLDA